MVLSLAPWRRCMKYDWTIADAPIVPPWCLDANADSRSGLITDKLRRDADKVIT